MWGWGEEKRKTQGRKEGATKAADRTDIASESSWVKWRAGAQRHHPGWNSIVQEAERKCKDRGLGLDL